jgi:prophage regulatory protein
MNNRLLRLAEVRNRTALSRSSIYAYMAEGKFPQPVNIGPRSVAWIESDVTEWVAARIAGHRKAAPRAEAVAHD